MSGVGAGEPPGYVYASAPASFLSALLARIWYRPVLRLVPIGVSANALSLLGTLSAVAALGVALHASRHPGREALLLGAAALYWAYHTLDNLDGPQARRRGTCGPFGELLDHGGDALTTWTPVLALGVLAGLPSWTILGVTALQAMAFWAVLLRQAETGLFDVRPLSDAEPALLVTGALVTVGLGGPGLLQAPLLAGCSAGECMAMAAALGASCVTLRCALASGLVRSGVASLALLAAGGAVLLWDRVGPRPPGTVVGASLAGTALAGPSIDLLRHRLLGRRPARVEPGCAAVASAGILGASGLDAALGLPSAWAAALLVCLLVGRTATLVRAAGSLASSQDSRSS